MPALQLPADLTITVVGNRGSSRKRPGRRVRPATTFLLGIAATLLYFHLTAEPRLVLSQASLQFAPTTKGAASDSRSVELRNVGSRSLHVGSIEIRDEAAADFAITHDCSGDTVAPQNTCTVTVVLTPQVAGERRAELVIPNDSDQRTATVTLTGVGRVPPVPDITATPVSLSFEQPVSVTSTMSVLVRNTGTVPVDIADVTLTAPNTFNRGPGCERETLPVGGTCTFAVTFVPTQAGESKGEVKIGYASDRVLLVPISATAAASPPAPSPPQPQPQGRGSVEPKSLLYRVERGKPVSAQAVAVKNVGDAPIRVTDARITKSANDFAVRNHCDSDISPGGNCSLEVAFVGNPTVGSEGTLVVSMTDAATIPVNLIAEPVPVAMPTAEVTPTRLMLTPAGTTLRNNFAAMFLGARDVITVHNGGNAPLEFSSFDFQPPGEFSLSSAGLRAPCARGVLPPGGTCEIRIGYRPNNGAARAVFLISDNAENSPQRVLVYGENPQPLRGELQVDPYNHDFGNVAVGTYSVAGVRLANTTPSQRITLRNVGRGNVDVLSVQQPQDSSYTVQPECPRTLTPSATCMLLVTFRPTTIGAHAANAVIQNDGSTGNLTLSFQGVGFNPYSKAKVLRVPPPTISNPQ